MTSKADLARLAASYTGPIQRISKGVRAYGEREMYLRTEAPDFEVQGERIENDLARRQSRMTDEQWAETRQQQLYEDRRARMGY